MPFDPPPPSYAPSPGALSLAAADAARGGPPPRAWTDAPAAAGQRLEEVDTPALLIDLDAFDANLARVHGQVRAAGLDLRPHGKAHKTPAIALRQRAAGAVGICCQKASEAEAFADGGVDDILITNQLVGPAKADRAARLALRTRLGVCADHPLQVAQLAEAARRHGARIRVLVEVEVGSRRCGVGSAGAAQALARAIAEHGPHLRFGGLHAYQGTVQHVRDPAERAATVAAYAARVRGIVRALADAGIPCETVTGGGTGSYPHEAASGLYTEVQPGSYVLMDGDYADNRPDPGTEPLRHALFAWCTVIHARPGHAVIDGGLKAFATDHGLPRPVPAGWTVSGLSDEHGILVPGPGAAPLAVGDRIRLVPGHCDPTVNLHDWLVAVRGGVVEEVWPVAARGALF